MTGPDTDALMRALARAPDVTPPSVERDARIGTTIREKYTLERVLGEGGMAIVYEARHRNAKRFAIKVLREKYSTSEVRARFVREGYVANTVAHPGAVAILDDDVAEDGAPFIVMELLEGAPLDRLVSKGPLPLRPTLAIVVQLLDVLAAAHAKGIVHRDVKPQNVFVTREGDVKVLDFGIARMRSSSSPSSVDTTQQGAMLGTPAFMPPEQALGRTKEIDAKSDIWSVGATMFTLLTGRFVHEGELSQEVAVRAATQRAPSIASIASTPPDVARIVDRALAFDKGDRWPDAASMRDALRLAHEAQFQVEPSAADVAAAFDADRPSAPARRERGSWMALGVGLGIVCVSAVAIMWVSKSHSASPYVGPPVATASERPLIKMLATTAPPPPPAVVVAPSAAPSAARPAVPRPSATHNCNPPYTVQDNGKRIPKPECL